MPLDLTWPFAGRYANLNWEILGFVGFTVISGVILLGLAFIRASCYANALVTTITLLCLNVTCAMWGAALGYSDPVIVSGKLAAGTPLLIVLLALVIARCGRELKGRSRRASILLYGVAGSLLLGTTFGWIRRAMGPSKFDAPRVLVSPEPDSGTSSGPFSA